MTAARAALPGLGRSDVAVAFVPVSDAFAGHRLCDTGPSWINGLQFVGLEDHEQTSFHPNALGQQAYARAVTTTMGW